MRCHSAEFPGQGVPVDFRECTHAMGGRRQKKPTAGGYFVARTTIWNPNGSLMGRGKRLNAGTKTELYIEA